MDRHFTQPTELGYQQRKRNLIFRVLLISGLVVFTLETLLMTSLGKYLDLSQPVFIILDGLILILFLMPINYFFVILPMTREIDDHNQTNQELVKSNEILERLFSIADLLIAYMDTDFNFLRVNQAYSAVDERPPEEFIGKNHFDLFPNPENKAIFESVVRTGKAYFAVEKPFEYAEHPERGITFWDWSLLPVKNPQEQVIALILVLTNVTGRKMAQLAMVDSERRFRAVFNQTFQHNVLLDSEGKALLVNQTALDFSGLNQEEITGLPLWQIPWWNTLTDARGITAQLEEAVCQAAGGTVVRMEQTLRSRSASIAFMDITLKPIYDELGSTILLLYEARDITERHKAEEALIKSEAENMRLYISERSAHQFAESLRNAVLAISESLNSETVLETLLDHLNKVVPYNSAHILLLDDQDHLVVRLARGEELWAEKDRLFGKQFEISDLPFFRPLVEERAILSVPDTLLDSKAVFLPNDEFVRCWLGIPLLAGEQVVGVCLLEHTCPGFFTEDLVHWATALTGQAAVAIQNAWLFEQVRDGREQLQALSRRLVEIQEHERHFIARELHDEASQALASMMIELQRLEHDSDNQPSVIAHCQYLKQITDDVLENLHRLAVDLRPASLDHLGLVAALRQYIESVMIQNGLTIQFEMIGEINRLPGEVETAIYRIVQESLTNVVRHAKATHVDVLLEKRNDHIIVIIEDDGVGFNLQTPKISQLGIMGMRERAEMLGGKITIESSQGKGSTILLEVPWQFES